MKKPYMKPSTQIVTIDATASILQGSKIYTDDPQKPEDALVKEDDLIWDEESFW